MSTEEEAYWYSSEQQSYFHQYAEVCVWAHPEAERCGCRGRGWWLSELDTWHQCPHHGKGVPHPEYGDDEPEPAIPSPMPPVPLRDDEIPF